MAQLLCKLLLRAACYVCAFETHHALCVARMLNENRQAMSEYYIQVKKVYFYAAVGLLEGTLALSLQVLSFAGWCIRRLFGFRCTVRLAQCRIHQAPDGIRPNIGGSTFHPHVCTHLVCNLGRAARVCLRLPR